MRLAVVGTLIGMMAGAAPARAAETLPAETLPAETRPAETRPAETWPEVKCARYSQATADALARFGTKGLGAEFLDRHAAFLATGCTGVANVCPRSAEELHFANVMVMVGMGQGMASTFMPFACNR